jgi:hypothetical protein
MNTTNNALCKAHSGIVARIEHLELESEKMGDKLNKIFNRINIILGGIVVSCVMLVINLVK